MSRRLSCLSLGLFLMASSLNTFAEEAGAVDAFEACKPRLKRAATEAHIPDSLANPVIDGLIFQAKVIEYDRRQPEFVQTFPDYFSKRVNDWRINKGREMLAKHRDLLRDLQHRYGIPAQYLVSFWGLETNFGSYKGKMPVLDSLATLACDARRSDYFTQEFLVALRLMQRENLTTQAMVGSWAGAMGHTQFMPTAYINYAIDGDNDGTVNLWDSEQDALASAANFLAQLGWTPGIRWGREVLLPDSFDYALVGKTQAKSVTEWDLSGVTRASGSPLGKASIDGYLSVPAGHNGPKFLVYSNFATIMRWNNSEFYAIAVGKLADAIAGDGGLVATLPDLPAYSLDDIKTLQRHLNSNGIDVGPPDGIMGPMTREGIRQLQSQLGMIQDGFPAPDLMKAAGVLMSVNDA